MRRLDGLSLLVLGLTVATQFSLGMLLAAAEHWDTTQALWWAGGCLVAFLALWRGVQTWSEAWRSRKP